MTRNLVGQWNLTLYRDVCADFYNNIIGAPAFIEKASIGEYNLSDPAIFNHEDMTFNQIKTKEFVLSDPTRCKWVAAFVGKDLPAGTYTFSNSNEFIPDVTGDSGHLIFQNAIGNDTDSYLYMNPHNKLVRYIVNGKVPRGAMSSLDGYIEFRVNVDTNELISGGTGTPNSDYAIADQGNKLATWTGFSESFAENKLYFSNNLETIYADLDSSSDIEDYWNKKLFLNSSTGKVYEVEAVKMKEQSIGRDLLRLSGAAWTDYIRTTEAWLDSLGYGSLISDCPYASTEVTFDAYQFRITDVSDNYTLTLEIPEERNRTADAPYDIIVMPYSDVGVPLNSASANVAMPHSLDIVSQLKTQQSDYIYDIQLLPYCPVPAVVNWARNFNQFKPEPTGKLTLGKDFSRITDGENNKISWAYYLTSSKQSYNWYYKNFVKEVSEKGELEYYINNKPKTAKGRKIKHETEKFRLCSGDYSSIFEFSPMMFDDLGYWKVNLAYKPYNSYIHIAPVFNGYYGGEFGDPRGLVCTGDFSLSSVTDPYENYKLQNINFQRAFDRQIESLEVQQKYERIGDIAGAVSGTFAGAAGGAIAGSTAGPYGAIAGAIVGAAGSAIAGSVDISMKDKLRNEAIDYTRDQFGFQLGNIKALPNTLNKVDSFNQNNKIWPVLEFYTCTDIEKQALENKLKYNGCTIMRIGAIQDFLQSEETYVKAKIIRLDDLGEDTHIANTIAAEVNKGVFIKLEV